MKRVYNFVYNYLPISEKTIEPTLIHPIEATPVANVTTLNNTKPLQLLAPFNRLPSNYLMKPNENNDLVIKEPIDKNVIPPFMKLPEIKQETPVPETVAEIQTKPPQTSSPSVLKLSGCNIYGRMYRVGRIISELSGPCLECKCTESGVDCKPLDCLDVTKLN